MGVLDFLFQGQAPANATTSGTSTTNLPPWLNQYAQNTIAQTEAIAAQPYTPYTGPRIADFTAPQTQGFNQAESNVGNWQPDITQAQNLTSGAVAPGQGGLAAAAPYLAGASGSFTDPNTVSSYMNPYTTNVINQGTNLAMQNYNNNIKPSLDNEFTASGQFGSSAHERAAGQQANTLTQNIQQQDQGALSSAYGAANSAFNSDQARQAQLASTAGSLGSQGQNAQIAAAGQLGALGSAQQTLGAGDVSMLAGIGGQQQQQNQSNLDLAYSDFQNQLNWPKTQLSYETGIANSLPAPTSTDTTKTGPASVYAPSVANQIGSAATGLTGLYKLYQGMSGGSSAPASTPAYAGVDNSSQVPTSVPDDYQEYGAARGGLMRAYRRKKHAQSR